MKTRHNCEPAWVLEGAPILVQPCHERLIDPRVQMREKELNWVLVLFRLERPQTRIQLKDIISRNNDFNMFATNGLNAVHHFVHPWPQSFHCLGMRAPTPAWSSAFPHSEQKGFGTKVVRCKDTRSIYLRADRPCGSTWGWSLNLGPTYNNIIW